MEIAAVDDGWMERLGSVSPEGEGEGNGGTVVSEGRRKESRGIEGKGRGREKVSKTG